MKAVDFIRKFGWFGAKEYLAGSTMMDNHLMVFTNDTILKKYVDAWDLVEAYGGLDQANNTIVGLNWVRQDALKKAIELVESVNENQD